MTPLHGNGKRIKVTFVIYTSCHDCFFSPLLKGHFEELLRIRVCQSYIVSLMIAGFFCEIILFFFFHLASYHFVLIEFELNVFRAFVCLLEPKRCDDADAQGSWRCVEAFCELCTIFFFFQDMCQELACLEDDRITDKTVCVIF